MATASSHASDLSRTPLSRAYSNYVLGIIFLVQVLNYLDRNIIGMLVEPIKRELVLSDTALGALTGFAFAGMFAVAGLPLGWLADRANRRNILVASLLVWSIMTAACSTIGSLSSFVLLRMGVGLGEAGGTATTYPIVTDLVPAHRRSFAFGLISFGTTTGLVLGLLVGGFGAHAFGWRGAFLLAGLPGVLVAILIAVTVREPVRGGADAMRAEPNRETLRETIGALLSNRSFVHTIAGGAISTISVAAVIWLPAYFQREFGMGSIEVSVRLAIFQGIGSLVGTIGGGWLCDRLSRRDVRWQPRFAAWTTLLSAPAFAGCFLAPSPTWALIFLAPAFALKFACLGPYYAMLQSLAGPNRRSFSSSLSMFGLIVTGAGIGPLLIGFASDRMIAIDPQHTLRWALCTTLPFIVWGALHFFRVAQRYGEDLHLAKQHQDQP